MAEKKPLTLGMKLFHVQQEIGAISKDAKNPFFKSSYFDINSLIKNLRPLLGKYKLTLFQPVKFDAETGIEYVKTYLECAETSQRTDTSEEQLPKTNNPQEKGSAITYARRYTLVALLGLEAEDDDGNAASGKAPEEKPWLNKGTEEYSKVIAFMKGKDADIKKVEAKFKLSGQTKKDLLSL